MCRYTKLAMTYLLAVAGAGEGAIEMGSTQHQRGDEIVFI